MKMTHEEDYDVVVYMTEPVARFVSLVKRGANRTPFHIVKHQKETATMKIIQRIVAKKGVDAEAIKAAVGEEASTALNLSAPVESGAFAVYDQHPEDAFKSDSMSVVSLSDDKSIIAICGEMIEKSEGFVEKLFAKKSQQQGVSISDDVQPMDMEVLKADMGSAVWEEFYNMCDAVRGILGQSASEGKAKAELIKSVTDNFLKSVKTAVAVSKSEDFGEPKQTEAETSVEAEKSAESAEAVEAVEVVEAEKACSDDKKAEEEKACGCEDKAKEEEKADDKKKPHSKDNSDPVADAGEALDSAGAPSSSEGGENSLSMDALATKIADSIMTKVNERLDAACKAQDEALDAVKKSVESVTETVSKMQKAPAGVVASHEDSGVPTNAKKSQKGDNVFAGCFGKLR